MQITGVLVLSIIFAFIGIFQINLRKKLILRSEVTNIGKIALVISLVCLIIIVYRFGETIYDYTIILTGMIMTLIIISSAGMTEDGFKSISRLKSPTQKWNGVDVVEIELEGEFSKVTYSGNSEASTLYFKKEDYNKVVRKIKENITERTKIVLK